MISPAGQLETIVFGILVAFASNFLLKGVGENPWRWMLGVAAFPSILYTVMCFGLPESPRWLLAKGRVDEARRVLQDCGTDSGSVAFTALGAMGALTVLIAGWTTANPTLYRAGLALQLPAHPWLMGLYSVAWHNQEGHESYLLGRLHQKGVWYYFPVIFAVKTPTAGRRNNVLHRNNSASMNTTPK